MKTVTIYTDGIKPLCGFTGDAVLLALRGSRRTMADEPRRTGAA